MPDTHNTKNYFTDNGNELVVGGKLTFLEGAEVDGAEGLFNDSANQGFSKADYLADSTATTVAALKEDFNGLLAALRTAGLMEAEASETPGPTPEDEPTT